MFWVTTAAYRQALPELLIEVDDIRVGKHCTALGLYPELPGVPDPSYVRNGLEEILAAGPVCRYLHNLPDAQLLCSDLNFTALGMLYFTESDTWWPMGTIPSAPESWVNALIVVQFILSRYMTSNQVDMALESALDISPSIAEPYIRERLDELKVIISTAG